MTSSDKDLFSNMALRDPDALSTFYDLYSQFVYGYCFFFDRSQDDAEADTQAIFIELWRGAEAYKDWPFSTKSLLKSRIEICCSDRHARVLKDLVTANLLVTPLAKAPKLKVLYVEDHADTRRMTVSILEDLGYSVIVASAVNDAITLGNAEEFDILVSDINLPDGKGWDIVKALRPKRKFGAIAVSAFEPREGTTLHEQFAVFMQKPLAITELAFNIDSVSENHK